MEQTCSEECFDDNSKLESKVILALSRLQKGKGYTNRNGKSPGIGTKKIVEFLCANYCHLDGDIESQVITALTSCVKNGMVCVLDNGKYRLVGPKPRMMTSNCLSVRSHGPQCCCVSVASCSPNSRICCAAKKSLSGFAINKKLKRTKKQKSIPKQKPSTTTKRKKKNLKKKKHSCVIKAQESLLDIASQSDVKSRKCQFCLEVHPAPETKKICTKCHPPGTRYGVPFDKFSPRDEVDITVE